jgi:hypothetical protein
VILPFGGEHHIPIALMGHQDTRFRASTLVGMGYMEAAGWERDSVTRAPP